MFFLDFTVEIEETVRSKCIFKLGVRQFVFKLVYLEYFDRI